MQLRLPRSPSRRRVLEAMVEVLGQSAALTDARGRHQWQRELVDSLDGLELESYPTARQDFVQAVKACSTGSGGLETLVEVTNLLAPALSHLLLPLVDEWNATDLYEDRDWSALRDALDFTMPELRQIVAEITKGRLRLPAHSVTVWHAFVWLACLNSDSGGIPPSMVLLERIAARGEGAAAVGEIHAWNLHFAKAWGLSLDLLEISDASGPGDRREDAAYSEDPVTTEPPVIRLFIKIAPDLAPSLSQSARPPRRETRYQLSARVRYAESSGLHEEPGCEPTHVMSRARLPVAVAEMLTRLSERWRSRAEGVALHFFLPVELCSEPVEWWKRNPKLGYSNPLLSKYKEISIHSLERMQNPELHHAWRMRWARWRGQPKRWEIHWCDRGERSVDEHLSLLDARIGKQDEVVAMVLSTSPRAKGGLGAREVYVALDLGVPILVHGRVDRVSQEHFRPLIKDAISTNEGLAKLPTRLGEWKGDSAAGGVNQREADIIRHIGIVWDDPELLLDGGPSAPATFVGGID
ncbi:effector-associated domain 2-containing protein [Streptomyces sp. T028]|uniref:VMAP-C domain-containing protein n=1 Tax=Streptomyces sp. T028 TaxID=3394379 RepID=UPI003A841BAB